MRVDEERPYLIEADSARRMHGFTTSASNSRTMSEFDIDRVKDLFENAFERASGPAKIESDDFNRLVLRAQLGAREVHDSARVCEVSAAGGLDVQRCVHRTRAHRQSGDRPQTPRTVPRALRSGMRQMATRVKQVHRTRCSSGNRSRARQGAESRRRPHPAAIPRRHQRDGAHQLLPTGRATEVRSRTCRSSSIRRRCPACPSRSRCSRSGCTRRVWKACICAADAWRAAVCAGRTGARTSAPKCSA